MPKTVLEKSIEINAPSAKVWRVFTDPVLTRQMGGEYVADWQVGGSFGWKGLDGKMYTEGTILQIEPEKRLQHNLFSPGQGREVASVITYDLHEKDGHTTLRSREEFTNPLNEKEYSDASEGWDTALLAVKELAEK